MSVQGVGHDGAITFLAATGHQGAYEASELAGRWVSAGAWQNYWTFDEATALRTETFARVAADLGTHDIHPPLYTWALHVWMALGGRSPSAAAWLNVLFLVIAVALLDRLARASGATPRIGAAAATVWGLSAASLSSVVEPRPYVLAAAFSLALMIAVLHASDRRSALSVLALVMIGAAALLTHYHVALIGLAAGGVVAWHRRESKATLITLAGAGTASLAIALFVHPWLATAVGRSGDGEGSLLDFVSRSAITAAAVPRLLLPDGLVPDEPSRSLLIVLAVLGAALVAAFVIWRRRQVGTLPLAAKAGIVAIGMIAMLFLAGFSPPHSMGPRYTLLASPLIFAGLAGMASSALDHRHRLLGLVVVLFALGGIVRAAQPMYPLAPLPSGAAIVLDTSARGVLPRVVWTADPTMPVLAGRSSRLELVLRREPLPADLLLVLTIESSEHLVRTVQGLGYNVEPAPPVAAGLVGRVYRARRN